MLSRFSTNYANSRFVWRAELLALSQILVQGNPVSNKSLFPRVILKIIWRTQIAGKTLRQIMGKVTIYDQYILDLKLFRRRRTTIPPVSYTL
jgi:hypothetical protein